MPRHVPPEPDSGWPTELPSDRARDLIRQATTQLISDPEALFEVVDQAVLETQSKATHADPELINAIRESNRSNLAHWAAHNLSTPGLRVPVNRAEETVGLARLIARRGIEDTSRVAYGAGQNAAWTGWMQAVFAVTGDAAELQEVLDVSARSIFDFVERMLTLLRTEIERERGEVLSSANAQRLALINRVLAGERSGALQDELRYAIELYRHTAVVLSMRNGSEELLGLVHAAGGDLAAQLRRRPLTVVADADTVWAWFPTDPAGGPIDLALSRSFSAMGAFDPDAVTGSRAAIGPSRDGLDGFRISHGDALAAAAVAKRPVVTYDEVAIGAMVRTEPDRARDFIHRRLGGLPGDPELIETLAAYLAHQCSPTRTAAATFTHRNTIIDRIRRAEEWLRDPIAGNELQLAVALELARFYGHRR